MKIKNVLLVKVSPDMNSHHSHKENSPASKGSGSSFDVPMV